MSDVRPYGVTQHADSEMVTANELVGQRLDHPTVNQLAGSPATFSTAPYKRPQSVLTPGPRGCYGNEGRCGSPAMKGEKLCFFHGGSQFEGSPVNTARSRR